MRLPRFRIPLGTFLLGVAVLAIYLGGICNLTAWTRAHPYDPSFWGRADDWAIGMLPLASMGLVAIVVLVTHALGSLARRRGGNLSASPAGFTFFSLHFLALLTILEVWMPLWFWNLWRSIWSFRDRIKDEWLLLPEADRDDLRVLVLNCVVLGILLSGPLLLASWAGGRLAKRCAIKLPRWRFRLLAGMVSLGFAGVAFATVATMNSFNDSLAVPLDFRVVDQDTGRPVVGAFLRITNPTPFYENQSDRNSRAFTAADGRTEITHDFFIDGERNIFRALGTFKPEVRWLEGNAPGYTALRIPLTEVLGNEADAGFRHPHTVKMRRGETPAPAFRDIAGSYHRSRGMGGSTFRIETDGRYCWIESGCGGRYVLGWGRLTRDDHSLFLSPLRGTGDDANISPITRFEVIRWGDRSYLTESTADGLRDFCRLALGVKAREIDLGPDIISIPLDYNLGYLRAEDQTKSTGEKLRLPPKIWLRFALSEIDIRDSTGSLRQFLESVGQNIRDKMRPDVAFRE